MANENFYPVDDEYDQFSGASSGDLAGVAAIGNINPPNNSNDAAYRFVNIGIGQGVSVDFAQLRLYASEQGSGTGSIKFDTYGIKETNTSSFSGNPFGRTKTTAFTNQSNGLPGVGAFIGVDVRTQVNEILGQGGWSSGNAMGFLLFNNGSDSNMYIGDTQLGAQLLIRVPAQPNFTPTPGTVSSPSFPAATDYGIRVSQPGADVKTATETQLYYTSRKQVMKVAAEGDVVTSTGIYNVAHSLGYVPAVMGFMKSGDNRYKLTKYGGTPSGFIAADGTSVIIFSAAGTSVYYYEFIDPLQ